MFIDIRGFHALCKKQRSTKKKFRWNINLHSEQVRQIELKTHLKKKSLVHFVDPLAARTNMWDLSKYFYPKLWNSEFHTLLRSLLSYKFSFDEKPMARYVTGKIVSVLFSIDQFLKICK